MMDMLLNAPAQTGGYMIAGYTVIFSVMLFYIISLFTRRRSLEQDLEVLREIEAKKP
jgi:CcmD family protein